LYAVIRAGSKQFKVAPGDVIEIERLPGDSDTVEFAPLLVVDDEGKTTAERGDLDKASVSAKVLKEVKGPKVHVYKFRSKSGYRRHTGHRQRYTSVEISNIRVGGARRRSQRSSKPEE
jgi:large subunit ribosomal protein L21